MAFELLVHNYFTFECEEPTLHNAIWYTGSGCKIIDGKLYLNNELVTFVHTKFDKRLYL